MLTVNTLSKRYGDDLVLDRVSFTLNAGERVGLIGLNGSGKSTLLRIIAGVEQVDAGSVTRAPSDLTYGYLPQGWEGPPDATLADVLRDAQRSAVVLDELAALEARMAAPGLAPDDLGALLDEYVAAQERFEALGGYEWARRLHARCRRCNMTWEVAQLRGWSSARPPRRPGWAEGDDVRTAAPLPRPHRDEIAFYGDCGDCGAEQLRALSRGRKG